MSQTGEQLAAAAAHIIRLPSEPLFPSTGKPWDSADVLSMHEFRRRLCEIIRETTGRAVAPGVDGDPAPRLLDRLEFAWCARKRAERSLYAARAQLQNPTAVSMVQVARLLTTDLPGLERESAVGKAIAEILRLGPDAEFAATAAQVIKGRVLTREDTPRISDSAGNLYEDNALRIIWWLILRRREVYVTADRDRCRIHTVWLIRRLRTDLEALLPPARVLDSPQLQMAIERACDLWATYSCLQGLDAHPDTLPPKSLADRFSRANQLTTKVDFGQEDGERTRESEETVDGLRAQLLEVRESLAAERATTADLRAVLQAQTAPRAVFSTALSGLATLASDIDSKYSLDALAAISRGESVPISARAIASHLMYCLRKRGLAVYPDQPQVAVRYEDSSMYNCRDFAVAPGEAVDAIVESTGWLVRSGDRTDPVRRATLARVSEQHR